MSTPTTSLLAALNCTDAVHLVIGANPLAAARCTQSSSAGAHPLVIAPETADIHYGLQKHFDASTAKWIQRDFQDDDLFTLGRPEVKNVVDAVFVTLGPRNPLSTHISNLCKRNRIPVNVVDAPNLCTFTLLSTHTDGPLQFGVTTNGRGCKLASRIRRDLASSLPRDLGAACARLGDLRRRIHAEDNPSSHHAEQDVDDSVDQAATFNKLVKESDADADEVKGRRLRWLSQVCEYWPLKRLAAITDEDVNSVLASYNPSSSLSPSSSPAPIPSVSSTENALGSPATGTKQAYGTLILAGSGPGHPDLLTRATHKAIEAAHLILADKLVPSPVLDLIPRRTPTHIARKFPGNADAAQEELLTQALAAVQEGKTVLRLKQGDPFIYGRGGEEVQFFKDRGLGDRVVVLPGITSALSAPLFAGIPATQRDVSDQVLVCTGTGKKGKAPQPPEFVASRTVVFLMALHRISGLVSELTTYTEEEEEQAKGVAAGAGTVSGRRTLWPRSTPCAVIERASCPDQRVIRTTIGFVAEAIEQEGSRPPGLLVVGRACEALYKLEKGRSWAVEEGFQGLDLDDLVAQRGLSS